MAVNKQLPSHVRGLLDYLNQPHEKANEDRALTYFRTEFGPSFTRQEAANFADGYLPGRFLLELKGRSTSWLDGLFQALAYQNLDLNFSQVVVGAKGFLAVWQVSDLPESIRIEIAADTNAPNKIGRRFAKKYSSQKASLLKRAVWNGAPLFTPLFQDQPDLIANHLHNFIRVLREGKAVRQKITVRNFTTTLKEMAAYFDTEQPIKAVRAFYTMLAAWGQNSFVEISQRASDQITIGGERITSLIPTKREAFKKFAEARQVVLDSDASYDDFFARYDQALDAVDPEFRRKHGIYFTDLDLSRFVLWLAKRYIPRLGQDYLVLDPACGSGNLVTNWRSPLELRHKVVSEIEPELLFAVEQRMKRDNWHLGKYTVVPKVEENRGLNFLDCSAKEYLEQLREALRERALHPDKPLAILCNPPYRSDEDQSAESIDYKPHDSILALTGEDALKERYCCFLAQMKLLCEAAPEGGFPQSSLLLLFTKSAWLTGRATFTRIRGKIFESFIDRGGALFNGKEFFSVKEKWPVAFTIWGHQPSGHLDAHRSIGLLDLTWITKRDLQHIPWHNPEDADAVCQTFLDDPRSKSVALGENRVSIRQWSGFTMVDFKRDRRRNEKGSLTAGGLPLNDRRRQDAKTYGESDSSFIGFMDDLTPCRVKRSMPDKPWFRLNGQFMDIRKNRCLSGPPTNRGYCAQDLESASKLFFWYALTRTFTQTGYPMWVDADDLWEPIIPECLQARTTAASFAIAFAENECLETHFPANNPSLGAPEAFVRNPLTPLDPDSFWAKFLNGFVYAHAAPEALALVEATHAVFTAWRDLLGVRPEISVPYERPYFVGDRILRQTAGLVQIRDYATRLDVKTLLAPLTEMQAHLKVAKSAFYESVTAQNGPNYFGPARASVSRVPQSTDFDQVLARRLALAGLIVDKLHADPHFGRTKLAKLFYLADARTNLRIRTEYTREAAGPLDQRALYHERVGIEALGRKYDLFRTEEHRGKFSYVPLHGLSRIRRFAEEQLGDDIKNVLELIDLFQALNTERSEIIATLYACWNDLLLRGEGPTDEEIVQEFLTKWHPKKARFSHARLLRALAWMREHSLVPRGHGTPTKRKVRNLPPELVQ